MFSAHGIEEFVNANVPTNTILYDRSQNLWKQTCDGFQLSEANFFRFVGLSLLQLLTNAHNEFQTCCQCMTYFFTNQLLEIAASVSIDPCN